MVHIEKISLRGFKSFGNRRVGIPLSKGFTAIVGPNGSGKSNIVDGICFVLGRMSTKSLRAERLTDLIWAGNERFPPGSYAEVSLHLDNSDRKIPINESKVIISRRIDRTGRSVYRANKKRVSRTEIVDLLAMADIFPEGYNIVLQGDITKIIKMTPVERRMLIDELSGVAEYDEKKEKAMKELAQAEENIRATNLVIDEVLSQLRRLERERDEAVRYQEIITQIRELRWQLKSNQLRKYRERYEAILERTRRGNERIEELEAEISRIDQEILAKQQRQEELERTIEKRQMVDMARIGKQTEEVRAQIVRAQENLKNTQQNLQRQEAERDRLKSEVERLSGMISEKRNRVKVLETQLSSVVSSLAELKEKRSEIEARLASLEEQNSSTRSKLEEIESSLSAARRREEEHRKRSQELSIDLAKAREQLSYLRKKLEEDEKRLESTAQRRTVEYESLGQLEEQERKMGSSVEELRREIENLEKELEEVRKNLDLARTEKAQMEASLEAARRHSSPSQRGASLILSMRDEGAIRGVIGRVSELAKVDEEYKAAIWSALGERAGYIVVENRDVAEKCISILRARKAGWGHFLPLDAVSRRDSPKPPDGLDVIARAVDLVAFDKRYRSVFESLLGSTFVVKSRPDGNSVRLVGLDGSLADPEGLVSGGYFDPQDQEVPLLSFDEKDLEDAKRRLEEIGLRESEISERLKEKRSGLSEAERRLASLRAEMQEKKRILERLDADLEALRSAVDQAKAQIASAEDSKERIDAAWREAERKHRESLDEVSALEAEREALVARIESPEAKRLRNELTAVSAQLTEKITGESRLRSEAEAQRREIGFLEESLQKARSELEQREAGITGLRTVLEKIGRDIPTLEKDLEALKGKEEELRDTIRQLRATVVNEKREHSELVQRRDSLVEDKNRIAVEVNSLVYERSQLDIQIHNLEQELSLSEDEYEEIEIDDLDQLARRIAALETEKSRLEPVNMRAIEAYEETEEKFNEYKSKRDKVMEERDAILQFMAEIEEKKRQVFMEAFENIRTNFERIFAKLSPGGEGKLILENEEDPFEGGLEIKAKPAGKEVNVIESMSGGEKALTALAFIFAVQAYKPSPFYVLDEIDAHLDDDNVKRVADLISESSSSSQFIVVTLRDSMMAQADELIGVSMEDDGVSKVVGVRMEAGRLVEAPPQAEAGGTEA